MKHPQTIDELLELTQKEKPSKERPYTLQMVYDQTTFNFDMVMPSERINLLTELYIKVNTDPNHNLKRATREIWEMYFMCRATDRPVALIDRIDEDWGIENPEPPAPDVPSKLEMALYTLLIERGLLERLCELARVNIQDVHKRFAEGVVSH